MGIKLIIGADRGIAHAVSLQLRERGDDVLAATMGDGVDLLDAGIAVQPGFNVTSDDAVAALSERLTADGAAVDWLVHVAGVMFLDAIDSIDYEDVRRQFEINTIGPLRTIVGLRGHLHAGSKVGILTSRYGSIGDNSAGADYAYRISKAAANMVARNLSIDLAKEGIPLQALHPGTVNTHLLDVMTKDAKAAAASVTTTPENAAAGLIRVLDELTLQNSGQFQHANGQILPW